MIAQIIDVLNVAAETLPVDTRHGWAQIVQGQPAVHVGAGQWVSVANDLNGSWSYVRINGQARVEPTDIGDPCSGVRVRLPFRLVALLDRSECAELPGLLVQTAGSIRQARKQFVTASGAYRVNMSSILWQIDDFATQEFQPLPIIPSERVLVAIDIIMEVDAAEGCFEGCGELTDVVCAIIAKASNAKVVECLGPDRVAQICEGGGPCDPLTAMLNGVEIINEAEPCGAEITLDCDDPVNALVAELSGEPAVTLLFVPGADLFGFHAWYPQPQLDPALAIAWSVGDEAWGLWNITDETFEAVSTGDQSSPITATWEGGTVIQATIADLCPCEPTPCEDATLTWDGEELLTIPSGGTQDLDCNTLVNAAYAQDGGSVTGTYKLDGTLNSREVFRLDVSHNFEYTGTRWRLVKPGSDYDAAVGSETKPWDADWSATPVTVTQATIGAYCDDCVPCLVTVNITVNGEAQAPIEDLDPCEENTINITIE